MVALTIGMAVYNDFDGVYFTLQALRLYHDLDDVELLVVDNYGCEHTREFVEGWAKARYVLATEAVGTAAPRQRIFDEARGDAVLCCDAHVLFPPGTIARLKQYYRDHPDTPDLLQGPILADDLRHVSTHMEPVWHDEIWGVWATDPRGEDPEGEPFDIPMQGLGVFSCRKETWPGFNPRFRGFGGEEGYIHEKVRQAGGRTLCLPWLRWGHRFVRPGGSPYAALLEDKVKNYIIGHTEVGFDLDPIRDHFSTRLSDEEFDALVAEALADTHASAPRASAAASVGAIPDGITLAADDARQSPNGVAPASDRRAIVVFVEDDPDLIQQLLALRLSWLYANSPDTDLVVFGPEEVLAGLPDDLVKIVQQPVADDPVWEGYRYINAIACLNGAGAGVLDQYGYLLRTDLDTFITPAWNSFAPTVFTVGNGGYANYEDVRRRIRETADDFGLVHRGLTNVGTSWYGPTAVVRRAAALTEMLTKQLLTRDFADDPGQWPGWYRGVALRYAAEIAVNHCAPDARRSDRLDAPSTSTEPIERYPHIHCWHTDDRFSKHAFMAGRYVREEIPDLDMGIVRDYCLELSFRSAAEPAAVP
jgi:hypothetical protein